MPTRTTGAPNTATPSVRPAQIDFHHEDVIVQLIGRLRRRPKAIRLDRGETSYTAAEQRAMPRSKGATSDDMLDAIAEHGRHAGRRAIGEELADDLLRSTWHDGD
jgi:hypothetical protein